MVLHVEQEKVSQKEQPHHELRLGGLAPWPCSVLSLDDIERDPAGRCCLVCGASLLLLILDWSNWVSHRTEHVTFRDDRSVVRRVTAEFQVPDRAPIFAADDGKYYRLVPLSIMRRKTAVNFTLRDEKGRSVVQPRLRQNQAITESMLLACADAILASADTDPKAAEARTPEGRRQIARFIHQVVSGTQPALTAAYESVVPGAEKKAHAGVLYLAEQHLFRTFLDRLADNFVLWVMIPADGPRRQVLTFCCDEPLQLRYRESGFVGGEYKLGDHLKPWHPVVWRSALGFTMTRIRFPVPAAENTDSFHFEIDAPKGVQIAQASLLAGRPGRETGKLSFDHVQGGFPTVGLHVIEVPNGSLSRVQIGLQVVTRGWLMTSTLAAWAIFALLVACFRFRGNLQPNSGAPALILVAVAAGVAALIAQAAAHGLAAYLLKWARVLAAIAAALPLIVATCAALEPLHSPRLVHILEACIAASGVIAVILSCVCLLSWSRLRKTVPSPWEQNRERDPGRPQPKTFNDAEKQDNYKQPAMRVDSAEGWRKDFEWDEAAEAKLIDTLEQVPGRLSPHTTHRGWW
jgi:hypothetical protein